jgi:hypothetical protein
MSKPEVYLTSFCNHRHRLSDGKPVEHECFILPTEALHAERAGDTEKATEILSGWKKRRTHRGLKENGSSG